jgi:hypothetical protein
MNFDVSLKNLLLIRSFILINTIKLTKFSQPKYDKNHPKTIIKEILLQKDLQKSVIIVIENNRFYALNYFWTGIVEFIIN